MCLFGIDRGAITFRVDEWIRLDRVLHALILLDHVVIATVRAQEHIAFERTEGLERLLVVVSDPLIRGMIDEMHTRIDRCAAHKNHIVDRAGVGHLHGPRRASDAVSGREPLRYSAGRHALDRRQPYDLLEPADT
jgi:hypothetical protein